MYELADEQYVLIITLKQNTLVKSEKCTGLLASSTGPKVCPCSDK